jgi:hypothetical protein
MKHTGWIFYIVSFACWLLPFALRVLFVEIPQIIPEELEQLPAERRYSAAREVIQRLSAGDRDGAFLEIFSNNLKGCIINIAGGGLVGFGHSV